MSFELLFGKLHAHHNIVKKIFFLLVHLQHPFLNWIRYNKAKDVDILFLPNAMHSLDGLVLAIINLIHCL
jgi:hypothetical protein